MNCYHHPDRVAVATCAKCGKNLCKECVDSSEFTYDNKPLCRDCNREEAIAQLANAKSERTKNLIKMIILSVTVAIGLPLFIYGCCIEGGNGADFILGGLFVMCIGGVPYAWRITKRSKEEKIRDAADDWVADQEGVGGSLVNSLIRGLVRIALVVVFGSIAAPILLIVSIVRFVKGKKDIEILQQLVDSFQE